MTTVSVRALCNLPSTSNRSLPPSEHSPDP